MFAEVGGAWLGGRVDFAPPNISCLRGDSRENGPGAVGRPSRFNLTDRTLAGGRSSQKWARGGCLAESLEPKRSHVDWSPTLAEMRGGRLGGRVDFTRLIVRALDASFGRNGRWAIGRPIRLNPTDRISAGGQFRRRWEGGGRLAKSIEPNRSYVD